MVCMIVEVGVLIVCPHRGCCCGCLSLPLQVCHCCMMARLVLDLFLSSGDVQGSLECSWCV
jgi:hypothetical protein